VIPSNDLDIRKALHQQKLSHYHNCPKTFVIDELGLVHGKNRIDIAVFNGCLHGYEIKSSKDTLSRFPEQLRIYRECLEKLTLVVASNHLEEVLLIAPPWCGVLLATKGPQGRIYFKSIRRSKKNPEVNALSFAHLLWKKEAISILEQLGAHANEKLPRLELYKYLCELVSIKELSSWIKAQFIKRDSWRAAPQP